MRRGPLDSWCRLYREAGQALSGGTGPRQARKGSAAQKRPRRATKLERACAGARSRERLPKSRLGGSLEAGRSPRREMLRQGHSPTCWRPPGSEIDLLPRRRPPGRRGRSYGRRWRRCSPARPAAADLGQVAMAITRRGGRGDSRQDRTEDHARDGHQLRHPGARRLPQVQLVQRRCRQGVRQRPGRGLLSRRTLAEARHGRHRVQAVGCGTLLRTTGSKEIVSWSISRSANMAQQRRCWKACWRRCRGRERSCTPTWDGGTSTTQLLQDARGGGHRQACREKNSCITTTARPSEVFTAISGQVLPRAELRGFGVQEARGVHRPTGTREAKKAG